MALNSLLKTLDKAAEVAKGAATVATETALKTSKNALSETLRLGGQLTDITQQLPSDVADTLVILGDMSIETFRETLNSVEQALFTDVMVYAYILHHPSDDIENYNVHMDMHDIVEQLHSGILVRPRLRLYTGRVDMDRDALAGRVEEAFVEAFRIAKEDIKKRRSHESRTYLQERKKDLSISLDDFSWSLSSLVTFLISHLLTANPWINALFLLIAVSNGKDAVGDLVRSVILYGQNTLAERDHNKDLADIDADLQKKQSAMHQALMEMELSTHRELYIYTNRGHTAPRMAHRDRNAKPLPSYVTKHMDV